MYYPRLIILIHVKNVRFTPNTEIGKKNAVYWPNKIFYDLPHNIIGGGREEG